MGLRVGGGEAGTNAHTDSVASAHACSASPHAHAHSGTHSTIASEARSADQQCVEDPYAKVGA